MRWNITTFPKQIIDIRYINEYLGKSDHFTSERISITSFRLVSQAFTSMTLMVSYFNSGWLYAYEGQFSTILKDYVYSW